MEGEVKLPAAPPMSSKSNLARPINQDCSYPTSSSTSSSFKSNSPDFLRNVQAAFKRHRPLGAMQSNNLMPRRVLLPQQGVSKTTQGDKVKGSFGQSKESVPVGEIQEDASITPPSFLGAITNTYEESSNPPGEERYGHKPLMQCHQKNDSNVSSCVESQSAPVTDGVKKVQFALAGTTASQGADDRMATGMDDLSSHMSSLALTEMEWDIGNPSELANVIDPEQKHQNSRSVEIDSSIRADGASSSCVVRLSALQDQLHHLRTFLQSDINHPMTQSSFVGSCCATTTSVHATSAPMPNSMTNCSFSHQESASCAAVGSLADANLNSQHVRRRDGVQQSYSSCMVSSAGLIDQAAITGPGSSSVIDVEMGVKEFQPSNAPKKSDMSKDPSPLEDNSIKGKGCAGDVSQAPTENLPLKDSSSHVKLEPTELGKQEKIRKDKGASAPRKKNYDPDLFFKVNGKLYQRLGKIGSGGSSEVHKVISSDCTIYALKKIKLKGRDYATAYGFCQEILYLNKLKGKSNIIQLIDYEVTDKALLQEVMSESVSNKDGRVKEDGYIFMVLEYGEIDLARMLSQKWKEMESSQLTIDENWLRFHWQQILQAVNTIHEERIVHSDLKPANFLLVKGSLKLIDFGIAKAIMSDTTNIQRDSQVGTLSYMSPEAFMCNESDANGNTIKCGRPSDIWSLGCILYQMVYGRTPFSEYKTFWAKFKVITDPNHEITYEPVSNPWLLDLMKKCLAWDRSKRWRIPQLLQHPFLAPPVSHQFSNPRDSDFKIVPAITESCADNQEASALCFQLRQLLSDATPVSRDQQCRFLSHISTICIQLREHIQKTC